jgi:hypothetical protein
MIDSILILDHLNRKKSDELEVFEHFANTKTFLPVMPIVGMFIDLQGFGNEEIEHLEKFLDVREVKKIVIINEEEIEVWLS